MREAAGELLGLLDEEHRRTAAYAFTDDERFAWQHTPGPRGGLWLAGMGPVPRSPRCRPVSGVATSPTSSGWVSKSSSGCTPSVRRPRYDNTQNDANHVHTVLRDVTRDWGADLLRGHYRHAHPA